MLSVGLILRKSLENSRSFLAIWSTHYPWLHCNTDYRLDEDGTFCFTVQTSMK